MTDEEWSEVEERLKSLYDTVKLKCDGYNVTLRLTRVGAYELGIVVWVNGQITMKWMTEDCEESRRFLRRRYKYVYSQKGRMQAKKRSVKALLKKEGIDPEKKYTYYDPMWKSFRALKKQLIAENEVIELVREEPAAQAAGGG